MLDKVFIDKIIQNLMKAMPESIAPIQAELHNNLQAIFESNLSKLGFVSYEEFHAQQKVLQRTREKLNELEQKLKDIESS